MKKTDINKYFNNIRTNKKIKKEAIKESIELLKEINRIKTIEEGNFRFYFIEDPYCWVEKNIRIGKEKSIFIWTLYNGEESHDFTFPTELLYSKKAKDKYLSVLKQERKEERMKAIKEFRESKIEDKEHRKKLYAKLKEEFEGDKNES